jgi:uncharacterized membrane protein
MPLGLAEENAEPSEKDNPAFTSQRAVETLHVKPEVVDKASELLKPLLRDPTQAPKTAAQLVAVLELHEGPLPHPRTLNGYEDIVPGAAREILEMAKREQRHRHRMENREAAYPYFGMGLGGLCLLSCITGAVFVAANAYSESIGLSLIGAPVLTGTGWFINARLTLKAQANAPASKSTPQ